MVVNSLYSSFLNRNTTMFITVVFGLLVLSTPGGNAVVRTIVACMQRNEVDMLDYWLQYYTSLFGIESVLLLDNYSDDPAVLETLHKWEVEGLS